MEIDKKIDKVNNPSLEERFCESLRRYVDSHVADEKKGYISRLAKLFGVTQGFLSNVIAGRRHGDETWRRLVAKKLKIDYDVMIGLSDRVEPSNVIPINGQAKDPRLQAAIDKLTKIFCMGTLKDIEHAEDAINKWLELIELKQKEPKREIEKLAK